jgi:hypothetical protein
VIVVMGVMLTQHVCQKCGHASVMPTETEVQEHIAVLVEKYMPKGTPPVF